MKPEVKSSGEKKDIDDQKPKFHEYIISAPKPQEAIQRPRYRCAEVVRLFPVYGARACVVASVMVGLEPSVGP